MDTKPPSNADADTPVPAVEQGSQNYLHSVVAMGDRRNVVAQQAIYTGEGVKLIDKGTRVDSGMHARLIRHRLQEAIENQLTVDDVVTVASIVALAQERCTDSRLLQTLLQDGSGSVDAAALLAPLRMLALPAPLAFTLTVMREQFPAYYAHSLQVALVAVYLALRSGWAKHECAPLAAAGLLHDIGVLYMDPAWHDSTRQITGAGRKHLMAHPVTAALLVRSHGGYPASVARAIEEHHERMDATGYPRGLRADEISPMGQILLVAEVVAAFFEKYADDDAARRLWLTLRLSHRKYPSALTDVLLPALQRAAASPDDATIDTQDVRQGIQRVADGLQAWTRLSAELDPDCLRRDATGACRFVAQRIDALQRSLFEAGMHPEQQAKLLPLLEGDDQGLKELLLLGNEALWQLQAIAHTASDRWPALAESAEPCDQAVARWSEALLGANAVPGG